ncbi:MAG: ABC transporter permease [Alphaproteobacteria bacterium]
MPHGRQGLVAWMPAFTILLFLSPVTAGIIGTALPAFGYLPAIGGTAFSLDGWRTLLDYPGIANSIAMTIGTGFAATGISLFLVILFTAACHGTRSFQAVRRMISPLLSVPHAAVAIGLAFFLAPSGWMVRLASPWATGFERPPDLSLSPDPYGLTLVAALVIKETPFLLLMLLAALSQIRERQTLAVARSMGYGPTAAWLKTVFPQVYPLVRLPVYAVLAFSLSVVDMAAILTPTTDPTLALLILRWFNDPDLAYQFVAAAGSVIQLAIVIAAILLWRLGEMAVAGLARSWISGGNRHTGGAGIRSLSLGTIVFLFGLGAAGLISMAVWSVARRWRFPDALPSEWTLANWMDRTQSVESPLFVTLIVALASVAIAVWLVVGCLENEQRNGRKLSARGLWLLYTPLIVPQIAFLFGLQVLITIVGIEGSWLALIWSHLLFVLPYVFLSLGDTYRALDERYARSGFCLGLSASGVFWRLKLPLLLRPVLIAAAVGFAVSVSQYLPTVFAGAGRMPTLTTEAVALSSGGDRRLIGVLVVLQTLLPFAAFLLASAVPAWLFRNRSLMKVHA